MPTRGSPGAGLAPRPGSIVLGPLALPYRATLFDKSPDSNWLVAWHQDTPLPLQKRDDRFGWGPWSIKDGILYAHAPAQALSQVLSLRLHLDASTAENGPLRVLPATHDQAVCDGNTIQELAAKIRPIECIVPRGGVLAMRRLLVHASSSPSRSSRDVFSTSNMQPRQYSLALNFRSLDAAKIRGKA